MSATSAVDLPHAVILGAGPGLGAAIGRRFGREGFALTLVARREAPLEELADSLRADGIDVATMAADAGDATSFRSALTAIAENTPPSVVVYNAAVIARDDILTIDAGRLLSAFAIDVLGAVVAAQVFTPAMRRAHTGTFLATGGSPGMHPEPAHASLSVGKVALRSALTLMHDELKADGVHASSVTIGGDITAGTAFDPDRIAEVYWALHAQAIGEWSAETLFDGR